MINEENKFEIIERYCENQLDAPSRQEVESLMAVDASFRNTVLVHQSFYTVAEHNNRRIETGLLLQLYDKELELGLTKISLEPDDTKIDTPSVSETKNIELITEKKTKVVPLWKQPWLRVAAAIIGLSGAIWLIFPPHQSWADKTLTATVNEVKKEVTNAGVDISWKASIKDGNYKEAKQLLADEIAKQGQNTPAALYYYDAFLIIYLNDPAEQNKAIDYLEKAKNQGHPLSQVNKLLMIAYLQSKEIEKAQNLKHTYPELDVPDNEILGK